MYLTSFRLKRFRDTAANNARRSEAVGAERVSSRRVHADDAMLGPQPQGEAHVRRHTAVHRDQ